MSPKDKIPVAISSCLLGEKSRYDHSSKPIPKISNVLADYFIWVHCCPEMEIGLPAPRERLNLAGEGEQRRLIGEESGIDYTQKMKSYALARSKDLSYVCGYILKSKSPSCAILGEQGIFAEIVSSSFPDMPMIDENGLSNNPGRKRFIEKVYAYHLGKCL